METKGHMKDDSGARKITAGTRTPLHTQHNIPSTARYWTKWD